MRCFSSDSRSRCSACCGERTSPSEAVTGRARKDCNCFDVCREPERCARLWHVTCVADLLTELHVLQICRCRYAHVLVQVQDHSIELPMQLASTIGWQAVEAHLLGGLVDVVPLAVAGRPLGLRLCQVHLRQQQLLARVLDRQDIVLQPVFRSPFRPCVKVQSVPHTATRRGYRQLCQMHLNRNLTVETRSQMVRFPFKG